MLRALARRRLRASTTSRADGNALIARLAAGPTNDRAALPRRRDRRDLRRAPTTAIFFAGLPATAQRAHRRALGPAGARSVLPRRASSTAAASPFPPSAAATSPSASSRRAATTSIPTSSYHDPDLPPPHGYLAFYAWLRESFGAHAVVHLGKHGNLEWLPGKALALSADCFPEAALGPLPHLYPFIVNDPGEGTQAKRRAQAVIIDHLTPPLTRAESYGPLRELERLVDEYYEAAGVDPRRLRVLADEILSLAARHRPRPRLRHRPRRRRATPRWSSSTAISAS